MSLNKSTPLVLQVSKLRTKKGRTEGISYSESFCHTYLQTPSSVNQKKKRKETTEDTGQTYFCEYISVQFSRSVVSDSVQPHESQASLSMNTLMGIK